MKRKIEVDSYRTWQNVPMVRLATIDGRHHTLTVAEVRTLIADIRAELINLDPNEIFKKE